MNDEMLNLSLTSSIGDAKTLRDWIRESPFTALVVYRGDW